MHFLSVAIPDSGVADSDLEPNQVPFQK